MLNNAIQYNQTGKTIGIQVTNLGIEFQIVIWDDGTSIQSKSGESIFDPFVRGDRARSSSGGTGLGLSIVKAIMDAHNQKYGVLNHEDGVEFWLELDTKE